jgi:hypothetical protein
VEMLKWGRHFLLADGNILITGRNQSDNLKLEALASDREASLIVVDYPGPFGLIVGVTITKDTIRLAAPGLAVHSDAPPGSSVRVFWKYLDESGTVVTVKME